MNNRCVNCYDVHVYLTLDNTYRAYIKRREGLEDLPYCDAWGSFRDSALRKLIENLNKANFPFDFSDAPNDFWGAYGNWS